MIKNSLVSRTLIVVPEGTSSVGDRALPSPAYRGSLDAVKNIARKKDVIILAPANKFNFSKFEQDYAKDYLADIAPHLDVRVAATVRNKYVDTMGNASLLNDQLQDLGLESKNCILVVNAIHAYRAKSAFRYHGFKIECMYQTSSQQFLENERLPIRLFYYRYKKVHFIYERIAQFYQLFRYF